MAVTHNPSITTGGLLVYLDAANTDSYPGSGNTWYDLMKNKNFTLQNSPSFLSSTAGGCISFATASSQYATSTSLASLTNWTVEVWHYYTGTNTGTCPTIITEVYPGLNFRINYNLGCTTSNYSSKADLKSSFFDISWRETANYALSSGNWYQIVGTYDQNNIKMYINGSLQNSTAATTTPSTSGSGIILMRRWDANEFWGGYLSTVKIYNRALSATEVSQNFNATRGRYGI